MGLEEALEALGRYGKWQLLTFFFVCMITHFPGIWQIYSVVYIGHPNPYHCVGKENVYFNDSSTIDASILNRSVPYEYNTYGDLVPSRCRQYTNYTLYGANQTEACTMWYIDPDGYDPDRGTIFMEWNLTCEREFLIVVSQMCFTAGVVLGFCFLGPVNDYFGRKPGLFYSLLLTVIAGFAKAFSTSFVWMCVFQTFGGFFGSNLYLVGFVIACEVYPTSIRIITATASYYFQSVAIMLLPLWAHFLRDWRTLQFAISVSCFPFMFYYWWCPESLRWLMANGRIDETQRWIDKAARCNNVSVPRHVLTRSLKVTQDVSEEDRHQVAKQPVTVMGYHRHCKLLMYTLIFIYLWNITAVISYGIAYLNATFAGNRYVNLVLIGVMELIGIIAATYSNHRWGRRYPLMVFHFLAFLFLAVAAVLDFIRGYDILVPQIITTILCVLGKFAAAGCTSTEAAFVPEVYPTKIRSTMTGLMFGLGFFGGIIAPISLYVANNTAIYVPVAAFAIMSLSGIFVVIPLPETHLRDLPETIEEVLAWPRTQSKEEWLSLRRTVKSRKSEKKRLLKEYQLIADTDM